MTAERPRDLNVLAIIPARAGSKGLPDKNLARLDGLPLVARAVRAARAAARVDDVVVTTDSEEIAAAARDAGAEVVRRPASLATDDATSELALLHVLEERSTAPDVIAFLQCTALRLDGEIIDGVIGRLDGGADSAFAAHPFHHFLWTLGKGGAAPLGHPLDARQRRQDQSPTVVEAGSVYAFRAEGFRAARHRFFGRVEAHVVAGPHVEIDDATDLARARAWTEDVRRRALSSALPDRVEALVLDFDGVLTDATADIGANGDEAVRVSRRDGHGIAAVRDAGTPVLVLSAERHPVVAARCAKLGVPCASGIRDKAAFLSGWLAERDLHAERTVYVGDDEGDLGCFALVGCAVAPADAHPSARRAADATCAHGGGRGAVREVCDAIRAQSGEER